MSFLAYTNVPENIDASLPCKRGDTQMDPDSLYNADTGLTMSTASKDFAPKIPFRQIIVEGGVAGQAAGLTVKVEYCNGAYKTWTLPALAANDVYAIPLPGKIAGIYKAGTTAILIFPFF